jgi:PTH1 family peptidyl-tRNA hydrolase
VRIIVGLGNPGSEYVGTRHNIGFDIVDHAAAALGARFRLGPGEYLVADIPADGAPVRFIKPLTYMNNSGLAVSDVLRRTASAPEEIVVVTDDFHLPLGRLRLRLSGSAGGHNGLRSIIEELGTEAFPRLRCGIAGESLPAEASARKDYVLRPFDPGEHGALGAMIAEAHRFLSLVIAEGPAQAQQRFRRTT